MAKKVKAKGKEIIDGKFTILGDVAKIISLGFGTFNTEELTEKQSELLVRMHVKWIVKNEVE